MYRDAYLESEILCASPVRLVELLYRGVIEAVRAARAAVDSGQIADRNRQIARAQSILCELSLSLDLERGGGLSRELVELYDYMQRRLNDANAQQRGEPIDEVRKLLETLLDGWVSLSAQNSEFSVVHMASNQSPSQFGDVDFEGAGVDSFG